MFDVEKEIGITMNNELYNKIISKRFGFECESEAFSIVLDYIGQYKLIAKHCFFTFLYNRSTFLDYKEPVNSYFNEDGSFSKNPRSIFRKDTYQYMGSFLEDIYRIGGLKRIKLDYDGNTKKIIEFLDEKYLSKDIPVIYLLDVFYLKEIYKTLTPRGQTTSYHNLHYIVLFDYDCENKSCSIIDPYFEQKGKIPISALEIATIKDSAYVITVNNINALKQFKSSTKNILIDNIKLSINTASTSIDGKEYLLGEKALASFADDFNEIIKESEDKFGNYSQLHISYALVPIYHQRVGVSNFFSEYNKRYETDKIFNEIAMALKKSSDLWQSFNLTLDKYFYKGLLLSQTNIDKMVESVCKQDIYIWSLLREINKQVSDTM